MKASILLIILSLLISFNILSQIVFKTYYMTDERDNRVYKVVKIGSQTWMAKNLTYSIKDGSWPLDMSKENKQKYGYLYTWEAAQNAYPPGWYLPSKEEWQQLIDLVGKKSISNGALVNESGWKHNNIPTNSSGFSALPGGNVDGEGFNDRQLASFWTSTEVGQDVWYIILYPDDVMVYHKDCKEWACFSLRCI